MFEETGRRYDSESRVEGSGDVIVDWMSVARLKRPTALIHWNICEIKTKTIVFLDKTNNHARGF